MADREESSDGMNEDAGGRGESASQVRPSQIKVQLFAVGGAPILKKNKFQVRDTMVVGEVITFLRKTLRIRDGEPLFVYLNSSFAPGLDQPLRSLHEQFNVNDELLIQYAITSSWG